MQMIGWLIYWKRVTKIKGGNCMFFICIFATSPLCPIVSVQKRLADIHPTRYGANTQHHRKQWDVRQWKLVCGIVRRSDGVRIGRGWRIRTRWGARPEGRASRGSPLLVENWPQLGWLPWAMGQDCLFEQCILTTEVIRPGQLGMFGEVKKW